MVSLCACRARPALTLSRPCAAVLKSETRLSPHGFSSRDAAPQVLRGRNMGNPSMISISMISISLLLIWTISIILCTAAPRHSPCAKTRLSRDSSLRRSQGNRKRTPPPRRLDAWSRSPSVPSSPTRLPEGRYAKLPTSRFPCSRAASSATVGRGWAGATV